MCPCCCYLRPVRWDVCTEPSRSAKRGVFGSFPNFCCPERRSGMNRISHPDWVKLYVELNYAPNQNTKIPSATDIFPAVNMIGSQSWHTRETPLPSLLVHFQWIKFLSKSSMFCRCFGLRGIWWHPNQVRSWTWFCRHWECPCLVLDLGMGRVESLLF